MASGSHPARQEGVGVSPVAIGKVRADAGMYALDGTLLARY